MPKLLLVSEIGAEFNDSCPDVIRALREDRKTCLHAAFVGGEKKEEKIYVPRDVIPLMADLGFHARVYGNGDVRYRCGECGLSDIGKERIYHGLVPDAKELEVAQDEPARDQMKRINQLMVPCGDGLSLSTYRDSCKK